MFILNNNFIAWIMTHINQTQVLPMMSTWCDYLSRCRFTCQAAHQWCDLVDKVTTDRGPLARVNRYEM